MDEQLSETLRRVEALNLGQGGPVRDEISSERLRQIAGDISASVSDRRSALARLSENSEADQDFANLILRLIDDSEADLAREAIAIVPPFDGRAMGRLRQLICDPRPEIWEAAALSLARKKSGEILPIMADWVRRGDPAHRRVGLSAIAFLLTPEPHLAFVESICEEGPRDDADEAILIDALKIADARVAFWRRAAKSAE